jgi:hypothetical protein
VRGPNNTEEGQERFRIGRLAARAVYMGNQAERGQGMAGTSMHMQRGMSNQGEMGGGVSRSGEGGGYKYVAGAAGPQGMGAGRGRSRSGALAAKYSHPHGAPDTGRSRHVSLAETSARHHYSQIGHYTRSFHVPSHPP